MKSSRNPFGMARLLSPAASGHAPGGARQGGLHGCRGWGRMCCLAAFSALTLLDFQSAQAVSITWDANGAAAGTGGTGNWDTSSSLWDNGTLTWPTSGTTNDAVFGGSVGDVSITTPVAAHNLTFSATGYLIKDGTLTLNGTTPTIATGANNAEIRSVVAGSAGLTKTGTGTLTLSGPNLYSGTTTIGGGTLAISAANNLGASTAITFGGGLTSTLYATANGITLNQGITQVSGTGPGNYKVDAGNTLTLAGVIGGAGQFRKEGGGTIILTNANTYSGKTVVNAGVLQLGTGGSISNASMDVVGGTYDLNGHNQTVSSTVTLGTASSSGNIISATGILTVGVSLAVSNGTIAANLAGSAALTKSTTATVAISGVNTYSGGTTVRSGTLLVNNTSASGTGTGAVSVAADATLGGTGTLVPTGTNGVNVSGILAPGAGIGTLTIDLGSTSGTVAMATGSSFAFELGTGNPSIGSIGLNTSDLLGISGASASDFAFNSNIVDFLNTGTAGFYKLFDTDSDNANTWTGLTFNPTTGVVTGGGLTYTNLAGGLTGDFVVGTASNGGTTGDIYFQVVPEPRAALLVGLGMLALLRRRRGA